MLILCTIQQHKYINTINKHISPPSPPAWWWYCHGFWWLQWKLSDFLHVCKRVSVQHLLLFHLISPDSKIYWAAGFKERPLIDLHRRIDPQSEVRQDRMAAVCISTPHKKKIISLQRLHDELLLLFGLVQLQSHWLASVKKKKKKKVISVAPSSLWSSGVSADSSGCGYHTLYIWFNEPKHFYFYLH